MSALASALTSPAPPAATGDSRAAMEARAAGDKARAARLIEMARDHGGDLHARFVTLIPDAAAWRDFMLHELGAHPYEDWNLALVTTAPEALEAGALPDWPDMAEVAEAKAAQGMARIEAAYRAGDCDPRGARAQLQELARDIRRRWELHVTTGE